MSVTHDRAVRELLWFVGVRAGSRAENDVAPEHGVDAAGSEAKGAGTPGRGPSRASEAVSSLIPRSSSRSLLTQASGSLANLEIGAYQLLYLCAS